MKLYLVRHGIAVEGIPHGLKSDAERPLTNAGKEETLHVAQGAKRMGVKPDRLISSPLVRARQTAEIFADVFGMKEKTTITEALAPGGLVSDLYQVLSDFSRDREICLFGHQPDMTRLAQGLLWSGPDLDMPFKKAGICRIDIFDVPPTTPGTLKWFLTPRIASLVACR